MSINLKQLNRTSFKYQEFFFSATAIKNNIDNEQEFLQDPRVKEYMINGVHLSYFFQELRDRMNKSPVFKRIIGSNEATINITSGFRCQKLNGLVGSKPISQHTRFEACDFLVNGINDVKKLEEIVLWIKGEKMENVDQCLLENGWIHLSTKLKDNRQKFGRLINGVYTKL